MLLEERIYFLVDQFHGHFFLKRIILISRLWLLKSQACSRAEKLDKDSWITAIIITHSYTEWIYSVLCLNTDLTESKGQMVQEPSMELSHHCQHHYHYHHPSKRRTGMRSWVFKTSNLWYKLKLIYFFISKNLSIHLFLILRLATFYFCF